MKTYTYAPQSSIEKVEFRQGVSGAEAVVFPSARPRPAIANFPDTLRKEGMSAEPILSGNHPALRVRGFTDESQVVDAITRSGLGTLVSSPAQAPATGSFAERVTASRQNSSTLNR